MPVPIMSRLYSALYRLRQDSADSGVLYEPRLLGEDSCSDLQGSIHECPVLVHLPQAAAVWAIHAAVVAERVCFRLLSVPAFHSRNHFPAGRVGGGLLAG